MRGGRDRGEKAETRDIEETGYTRRQRDERDLTEIKISYSLLFEISGDV